MRLKSGYVWILLVLATTACTPTPKEPQANDQVMPLIEAQREEEDNRLAVTRPVALTQVEKKLSMDRTTKLKPLAPFEQKQLLGTMIEMKLRLNEMKELYAQALGEEDKQWREDFSLVNLLSGWENLTPVQKEQWYNYEEQLKEKVTKHQNKILSAWGEKIAVITQIMEKERFAVQTFDERYAEALKNEQRYKAEHLQ